ncbi:hypothetical protein Tco_1173892 [Tanacetum coccineum]
MSTSNILTQYLGTVPIKKEIHHFGESFVVLLFLVGWNFVTLPQLDCTIGNTLYGHAKGCSRAWYLDDGTIIGDNLVMGKVLELIMEDGPHYGLHLNVDKTRVFWPKEDPKSRLAGVFPPNIPRPLHGTKLLSISKLYFAMHTCSSHVFEMAQCSFDAALHFALERIVTASGRGDVLNYAFLASRLQSSSLQTKLLLHSGIVASRPTFNDALYAFNTKIDTSLLSNASEIAAPKFIKKLADIYFTRVTQTAESTFSLSSRHIALWQSQMEDHTSDWLRVVPISGLGQTMNGDIYRDHAVSCAGIIGIKHQHNVVRDTLVDICFRLGILAGKKADIGLGRGSDKPLRPTGMVDFVPGCAVIDVAHR